MIKYGINTNDRYFGRNVIIRLDELKAELIEEFIKDLKEIWEKVIGSARICKQKVEEWEARKNAK